MESITKQIENMLNNNVDDLEELLDKNDLSIIESDFGRVFILDSGEGAIYGFDCNPQHHWEHYTTLIDGLEED